MVQLFQYRLYCTDDKRNSNKYQCDHESQMRVRYFDSKLRKRLSKKACLRIQLGECDTRDCGRQSKRKLDASIKQAFAGEIISDKHPGYDDTKHTIDECRCQRTKDTRAERMQHIRLCHQCEELRR